jgi:hypothetical protein
VVSIRKGHFVQVYRPIDRTYHPMPKPTNPRSRGLHPNYVEVYGRTISRTVTSHPFWAADGWYNASRELPRKRAVKFAKAYRKAGLPSRVIFRGHNGEKITDEFPLS